MFGLSAQHSFPSPAWGSFRNSFFATPAAGEYYFACVHALAVWLVLVVVVVVVIVVIIIIIIIIIIMPFSIAQLQHRTLVRPHPQLVSVTVSTLPALAEATPKVSCTLASRRFRYT